MNLRYRSREPELMDNEKDEHEIRSALKELKTINKFLGGNSVSRAAISKVRKKFNLEKVCILDAGSGASDILVNKRLNLQITSLDKNMVMCDYLKDGGNINEVTCGDALKLPFKDKSFDIVHSSLFLHHFDEEKLIPLLNGFCSSAKYAVIINDLQRSYLAYYGFKILTSLFSDNRLVKYDGLVSVQRAFQKNELKNTLERFGANYEIKWYWAFRWKIIIYCNG